MPELRVDIVDPAALSPSARKAFTAALYETHCRIFTGVCAQTFAKYVIDSPALRTRIKVLREVTAAGEDGRIVGYGAFHLFECEVGQRRILVVRGEIGLLPAYRRNTVMGGFMVSEVLRAKLRWPLTPMVSVVCATNPASYRAVSRYSDRVWPHWSRPTPPHIARLARTLAQTFALDPVHGAPQGVYRVGWCPRLDPDEDAALRRSPHPATRFYLSRNPKFHLGHGMLTLVSLDAPSLARVVARLAWRTLARGRAARSARAHRSFEMTQHAYRAGSVAGSVVVGGEAEPGTDRRESWSHRRAGDEPDVGTRGGGAGACRRGGRSGAVRAGGAVLP
ncbi:MAG: hypothetical protein ACE37F_09775 [Nannocystaceae bacterium]|nr:hypothetical protein [bacterium]